MCKTKTVVKMPGDADTIRFNRRSEGKCEVVMLENENVCFGEEFEKYFAVT